METLDLVGKHFAAADCHADGLWVRVQMARLDPAQRSGWKLHLSATPANFFALLEAALPVLAGAEVPFKALRDLDAVERMNAGEYGLMQVGKTLTVYPRTEEQAAALCEDLRAVLRGLAGPAVPSDLAYCDDAPIYFRFGPYDGRVKIDAMGQERRLLWRPDLGREVWDVSTGGPDEMPAPECLPVRAPLDHLEFLRDRFRLLKMLQLTAKGGVFIGVENAAADPVPLLIKTARPGTNSDAQGRDAVWALAREHALLTGLAGIPGVPEAGELITGAHASAIVRPYLHGETFWEVWTSSGARTPGVRARLAQTLDEVQATLAALHARGIVVRDVSAGNVLLGVDRAYLMDLELAERLDAPPPPYRRGTRGYFDPAKAREAAAGVADDAFALRVLRGMAAEGVPALVAAYGADAAQVQLGRKGTFPSTTWERVGGETWERGGAGERGEQEWNFYSGVAGYVWAGEQPAVQDLTEGLVRAASRVAHIPGLYFGASGMAVALGVLGEVAPARAVLEGIDLERSAVPDLCQGVAGYVLASVMLWETTRDAAFLQYAQNGAARLRALAREEDGLRVWPWPEGPFGDLSGAACYGFGHGVAGVVYALLRLHAVVPDPALAEEITRGLETLARVSRPVPGAPEACWWPVSRRDETCWNAWCHGTPGVLKTLSLAHKMRLLDDTLPHAALRGMQLANNSELCLCHGVASRLDAALDTRDAGIDVSPYAHAMQHDAALLDRALRGKTAEIFHDGSGLMTGPLGAELTVRRITVVPGATESGGPAPLSVS